ncbi:hypothetical protein AB7M74_008728 [Bradyrhizobium japonicum]
MVFTLGVRLTAGGGILARCRLLRCLIARHLSLLNLLGVVLLGNSPLADVFPVATEPFWYALRCLVISGASALMLDVRLVAASVAVSIALISTSLR